MSIPSLRPLLSACLGAALALLVAAPCLAQDRPTSGQLRALKDQAVRYVAEFEQIINHVGRPEPIIADPARAFEAKQDYVDQRVRRLFDRRARIQSDLEPRRLRPADAPENAAVDAYLRRFYEDYRSGTTVGFTNVVPGVVDDDLLLRVAFDRTIDGYHRPTSQVVRNTVRREAHFRLYREGEGWSLLIVSVAFYEVPIDVALMEDPEGLILNARVVRDYDRLRFTYDLAADKDHTYTVALLLSTDGGATYTERLWAARGDVGTGMRPGTGKRFDWDVLQDFPRGLSGRPLLRLQARAEVVSTRRPTDGEWTALKDLAAGYLGELRDVLNYLGRPDSTIADPGQEFAVKMDYLGQRIRTIFDPNARIRNDLDPRRLQAADFPRYDSLHTYLQNVYFFYPDGVRITFTDLPERQTIREDDFPYLKASFDRTLVGRYGMNGQAAENTVRRDVYFRIYPENSGRWGLKIVNIDFSEDRPAGEPPDRPNAPPVASDDVVETRQDEGVTIDALANDADPDGDVLVLSFRLPAHGAVTLNADDTFTYRPAPGYHGTDAFTYQVDDGDGGMATARVLITVAPAIPIVTPLLVVADGEVLNARTFADGDELVITYDLAGRAKKYEVDIALSNDGGRTFALLPVAVSGDLGKGITRAADRQIRWNVLDEFPDGIPSPQYQVRIAARPQRGNGLLYLLGGAVVAGAGTTVALLLGGNGGSDGPGTTASDWPDPPARPPGN